MTASASRKPPADAPPQVKSRWQELRDKSRRNVPLVEPYVFDGTEPPTLIHFPGSAEKVLELQEHFRSDRQFGPKEFLASLLGDQFETVWDVIKDENITLLLALINDIGDHFDDAWKV